MDDVDLIAGFLDGGAGEVAVLRRWVASAVSSFRAHLASESEDIEQDILLDLTCALREGRFRQQSRLQTYVRSFTHHKCIDRLRSARNRKRLPLDRAEDVPSPAPSALESVQHEQEVGLALRVFSEMPESCRELWQMLEAGFSYREMSLRIGVAEGALRARVLRCRRRAVELRERILAAGVGAVGAGSG